MKRLTSRIMIGAAAVVLMAAPAAFAQTEIGGSNLAVKKMYLKATEVGLAVNTNLKAAFTPTEVTCPTNGDCMVQVTVSAQIGAVDVGKGLYARVTLDGVKMSPATFQDITLLDPWINPSEYAGVRSFTWIKEITPGTHFVDVWIYGTTSVNPGVIGSRTLSIAVLK